MFINLKKLSATVLSLAGRLLVRLGKILVIQSPEEVRVIQWLKDNGDRTHRLKYDLTAQSLVLDLGGYEGQWSSEIFSMYCCTIHNFEPVPEFAENIRQRFLRNPHIFVHQYGLANNDISTSISLSGASSSQHKIGEQRVSIQLKKASKFFEENKISSVDLMKINIEGGEYDLLEHLISINFVKNIKNLQIQFHDFLPDSRERMQKIQEALERTHKLTYQYEFVWENWEVR
jgi:FkbM family methyltransferase